MASIMVPSIFPYTVLMLLDAPPCSSAMTLNMALLYASELHMRIPMFLQNNYCVLCGELTQYSTRLCTECEKKQALPLEPLIAIRYYCVHCGNQLLSPFDFDCHNDFHGTQRQGGVVLFATYHCSSCNIVAKNPIFDTRKYTPLALPFLVRMLKINNLPVHIYQAYQRQYNAIMSGAMTPTEY